MPDAEAILLLRPAVADSWLSPSHDESARFAQHSGVPRSVAPGPPSPPQQVSDHWLDEFESEATLHAPGPAAVPQPIAAPPVAPAPSPVRSNTLPLPVPLQPPAAPPVRPRIGIDDAVRARAEWMRREAEAGAALVESKRAHANPQPPARPAEDHRRLVQRMADDWIRRAPERQQRARRAEQLVDQRHQLELRVAEVLLARTRDRKVWIKRFASVYFLYVLPLVTLLSAAIVGSPIVNGSAFWLTAVAPIYNWVASAVLVAEAFAAGLPRVLPVGWDIRDAFALASPVYSAVILGVWAVAGVAVAIAYPLVAQSEPEPGWQPKAPVRPGGGVLAAAIAVMMVGAVLVVDRGASLSSMMAQTLDLIGPP